MKKVMIALMAIVFNMFLFSCDKENIVESDSIYNTLSTEGDDGDPPPPPPPPPPDE